jgi:serine/threonine protein kinase
MLGKKPWEGNDIATYRKNVLNNECVLKKADTPESWNHEASDLINKCLIRNPQYRMGINGTNEVKAHVWFKDFDWLGLSQQKLDAVFVPLSIVNYFDEKQLMKDRLA